MRDLKYSPLSPDEEANLESCGGVGFTADQVAAIFELDKQLVREQFSTQSGPIWDRYYKGRMQAELEVRQAILKSAQNGSTPSQNKILDLYDFADRDIQELQQTEL